METKIRTFLQRQMKKGEALLLILLQILPLVLSIELAVLLIQDKQPNHYTAKSPCTQSPMQPWCGISRP